ncbi:MAG: hypothetical protein ACXVZR_08410 [Terriglobales bacterium]|jgi:hypothetical protein|nr:hypothetical protein [Terriglobales bacterium]
MPISRTQHVQTPLNETRIWDYITFGVLVMLAVVIYSWLVPH